MCRGIGRKSFGTLSSVGLRLYGNRDLTVRKRDKSKGDALTELLVNVRGPASNGVLLSNRSVAY